MFLTSLKPAGTWVSEEWGRVDQVLAEISKICKHFSLSIKTHKLFWKLQDKKKTTHPRRKLKSNLPVQWNSTFARLQMLVKWLNIYSWLLRDTKLWLKHEKKNVRIGYGRTGRVEEKTGLKCAPHRAVWGLRHFCFCFWFVFKVDFYQHAENPAFKCDGMENGFSSPNCWCSKEGAVHFFLMYNFFYLWMITSKS